MTTENTGWKQRAGQFQRGQSGNPAGRPSGARNKATLAVEALLDGEAESITRKAIERALEGDTTALRLCMDRIAPARRDRHITFAMPSIDSAADAVKAQGAIIEAVAAGEITPSEASELAKLVDGYVKALEATEFDARLSKLEAAQSR